MIGSGSGRIFETVLIMGLPVGDGYVWPRVGTYVIGVRSNQPVISALFDDVRRPARDAGDDKKWRKHRRRNTTKVVSAGAVKIEVGEEFFLAAHNLLDALRYRVEPFVSACFSEFLRPCFDNVGARIRNLIDAMAEAHDQFLRGDELENAFFRRVGCVETLNKLHSGFVGSAVQRTSQCANGAGDGRIEIRQGRSNRPGGEGRCVKLVLGVENKRCIYGTAMQLIRLLTV